MLNRIEKVQFARRAAANGAVLLKNENGALPLACEAKVALFGITSYFCHRMGWGSGDMLAQPTTQYDRGLANAGIRLYQPLADCYRKHILADPKPYKDVNRYWFHWTTRFPEPVLPEDIYEKAAGECDVAIVTVGRGMGESEDLTLTKGMYYLHEEEEALIEHVSASFKKVVLVLNVCGVIDLSILDRCRVDAVLFAGFAGETAGDALADVLTGKVTPSGKLSTTWAYHYEDYPTGDRFASMEVPYHEGIYVGYRYFDTFGVAPRYPFGYGLSYTSFSQNVTDFRVDGTIVDVTVNVKNEGKVPGAEIVQCYLSCPDGKLEKPYQDLCAYAKTSVLESGSEEEVVLSFDLTDMASYCEKCACYVLEAGNYVVRVGASSRATKVAGVLSLAESTVTERVKNRFVCDLSEVRLLSKAGKTPFTYAGEKEEIANAKVYAIDPASVSCVEVDAAENHPPVLAKKKAEGFVTLDDVAAGRAELEDLVAEFTDEELAAFLNGVNYEDMANENVGGMSGKVAGEAGELYWNETYKIPVNTCADGPSGVRLAKFNDDPLMDSQMAGTVVSYPMGTLMAQAWDAELAHEFGVCVRNDMELADINGWLAPGVNIQRNPLCGRNFEYLSEDPLLSGRTAANVCHGVQRDENGARTGRYVTVKHYATNNEEYERGRENNLVTERALREIYLRSFRYAVEEGRPLAVMTSYNKINGEYAATSFDLLNGVLRGEYGFDGMVMTDWGCAAEPIRHAHAGNDVMMPGSLERRRKLVAAMADGTMDRADAQACTARVLRLIMRTNLVLEGKYTENR